MQRSCYLLASLLLPMLVATMTWAAPIAVRADEEYLLGPEDKIRITVLKHPEYDREGTVLADGSIVYHQIPTVPSGSLQIAGKTRAQVQALVTEALKFDLRAPQVTVELVQLRPRPVYVTGKVAAPTTLELVRGWRVSDVLAKCGGPVGKPELLRAVLRRADGRHADLDLKRILVDSAAPDNVLLEVGDQLDIQEVPQNRVFFLGQVNTPGPHEIQEGLGIMQALAQAGGANAKAALSKVVVIRGNETLPVDLRPLVQEGRVPEDHFKLQAGDVIVVPEHSAKVAIMGNVRGPGYVDLPEGERVTVTGVIHRAGGYLDKTKLTDILLIRGSNGGNQAERIKVDVEAVLKKAELAKDPVVQANDVIYVPKSGRIEPFEGLWIMQGVDWVLRFFHLGL
jgi:polysaccharide export outer membrane protein